MESVPGGLSYRVRYKTLLAMLIAALLLMGCAPFPARGDHMPVRPTGSAGTPLANRTVYWGQNTWLTALRASDGNVRWQTGHWGSGSYGPLATTLAGDTLYALGIDDHDSAAVYAIATNDGTTRWRVPVAGCLTFPVSVPLIAGGVVYVALTGHFSGGVRCNQTGWVYALRASDGKVVWRVPFTADNVWPTLGLTNGILVVASSTDSDHVSNRKSYLNGLRASDGKQLWQITRTTDKIEFNADNGLVIAKRTAGIRYDSGLMVEAFRASDGMRLWISAVIPSSDPTYFTNPLLANGMAYVLSASGDLYALRASDGQMAWHIRTGARWVGTPVFANGRLYAGVGPALDVFDASSGALVRSYSLFPSTASSDARYIWSAPEVTDGAIFVSAGVLACQPGLMCHPQNLNGKLYALDVTTGEILWQYQSLQGYDVMMPVLDS